MTSKERLIAAIEGNDIDHIPFSPNLAYLWEHFPDDIQKKGQLDFLKMIGADPLWRGAPCPVKEILPEMDKKEFVENDRKVTVFSTPVGQLRLGYMKSDHGNTEFLVEHPLKTENDYKVQMWIEENTKFEYDPEPVKEHFKGEGREGLSLGMLLPRSKSAFQHLVEHLAGTEELVYALMDFPETVTMLWEKMVENNLKAAKIAAAADYDYFITWEDSSTQNYSPTQYKQYISSEIQQWCKILKEHDKKYIQHACGHVKDLVLQMKMDGVFAVESISPPPTGNIEIKDAREKVGSDFGIIGGIEPTKFLHYDTNQLGKYVEQIIKEGKGGPFILGNSDSCPPGVTIEKFKLVADIARASS